MSVYLKILGPGVVACAAELILVPLYTPSLHSKGRYGIPKIYSVVIFSNIIYSTLTLIGLGGKVGAARKKCIESAKKSDDEEAESRYSLPKMQAEGFSVEAKRFNCAQRGHQQALETYGSFVAMSIIGGLAVPLVTAGSGLLWSIARKKWAEGYATGDPQQRYATKWGFHVWTALGNVLVASLCTSLVVAEIL